MGQSLTVAMPIYPGIDMIDVVAPHEILNWLNVTWPGNTVKVLLVAETDAPIVTSKCMRVLPDTTFARCPDADVLFVPGALPDKVNDAMKSKALMLFLKKQGAQAKWVCSVCVGALLLAKAGLLDGYTATTYWDSLDDLAAYPRVRVAGGYPRYVLDGNRLTGGGISSGFDEALALCEILSGDPDVARRTQLAIQYQPHPFYQCGDPSVANPGLIVSLQQCYAAVGGAPPWPCAFPK